MTLNESQRMGIAMVCSFALGFAVFRMSGTGGDHAAVYDAYPDPDPGTFVVVSSFYKITQVYAFFVWERACVVVWVWSLPPTRLILSAFVPIANRFAVSSTSLRFLHRLKQWMTAFPPPFVQAAPLGKGVQRGARDVRVTDHDTENPAKSNAPDATSLPPTYMDIHVTYGM